MEQQRIRFGLDGRVVVVTGGSQGIGEACARRLAADGARVALWDLADGPGQALAATLRAEGADVRYHHCNVALKTEVDAALAATLADFGRVDGLVNNAGIFKAAEFLDITEADWDAVIAVNVKGSFLVGQAVARVMVAAGRGAIVNMSSVNGTLTIPTIASYNVSKGGINQLTRVMALALADRGVRVNAVAPGTIATELAAKAVLTSDEAKARIMMRTPMKRLGEPGEIADVCAWLLSDASSYVTGEIVVADGGRMTLNYTVSRVTARSSLQCRPRFTVSVATRSGADRSRRPSIRGVAVHIAATLACVGVNIGAENRSQGSARAAEGSSFGKVAGHSPSAVLTVLASRRAGAKLALPVIPMNLNEVTHGPQAPPRTPRPRRPPTAHSGVRHRRLPGGAGRGHNGSALGGNVEQQGRRATKRFAEWQDRHLHRSGQCALWDGCASADTSGTNTATFHTLYGSGDF